MAVSIWDHVMLGNLSISNAERRTPSALEEKMGKEKRGKKEKHLSMANAVGIGRLSDKSLTRCN